MEKLTPAQRIIAIIEYTALTYSGFARSLGRSNAQYLHDIVKGKTRDISHEVASEITEKYPEIRYDWLRNGDGVMKDDKIVVKNEVVSLNGGKPYYDIDFENGFQGFKTLTHTNPEYFINIDGLTDIDFWINATGNSNADLINHGDIVGLKKIDPEWFPFGEMYGIVTKEHNIIKKITKSDDPECYKLVSVNSDKLNYPDQDIPKRLIKELYKVKKCLKMIN